MTAFNNSNTKTWQAPAAEVTTRKTIDKLKKYQKLTLLADEKIALLPSMQFFVNERLNLINNNIEYGAKITNGGIGDWQAADAVFKNAAKSLAALNKHAKDVLEALVKRTEKLGILPSDKAYFEGEKICYDADKKFCDLVKMLAQLEKEIEWIERKGFVRTSDIKTFNKRK